MKRAVICLTLIAGLVATATAQLPGAQKPQGIEKPAAPTKPVVPNAKITPQAATPSGSAAPFASELQNLSPEARAFATSKLSAITPTLRVSFASRITGKAVALTQIPETWLASAAAPAGARLWLGGNDVDLLTGPDVEAMFRVAGNVGAERSASEAGVWVQFNAEAGMRYLLICDMTNAARWDVVPNGRSRVPMTQETETRGVALIGPHPAGYLRILLTLARPQQTGPASSLMESLRRCEITPIRT